MPRNNSYFPELRERAVTMVIEHLSEYLSEWATMTATAGMLGTTAETLRNLVRQTEVDRGARTGLTTDEKARLKAPAKEVRELRRAKEILKVASVFFPTCC